MHPENLRILKTKSNINLDFKDLKVHFTTANKNYLKIIKLEGMGYQIAI